MLKPSTLEMSKKSRLLNWFRAYSARVLGGLPHPVHCSTPPQSPVWHEPLPLESNLQFVRPHMRAIFVPAGALIVQRWPRSRRRPPPTGVDAAHTVDDDPRAAAVRFGFDFDTSGEDFNSRGRLETPIWKAGKLYWLEADRQLKMFISFLWTLPSLRKDYLRKDEDSLAHLLGHGKAFWTWLSTYAADICTIVTAGDIRIKEQVIKQQSKVGQLGIFAH
nr:nardilysin-like isoform X2 [Ipomoea batatas]